jgi:hypothetical protein
VSNISQYPRIPVRTRSLDEGTRRASDAINYILNRLGIVADFARERAYLGGLTTPNDVVTDGPILNWDEGATQSDESACEVDPVTGEVTIGVAGVYEISANFIGVMTGSNVDHSVLVDYDPGGLGVWGTAGGIGVNTSKSNPGSITGFVILRLAVSDKVRLTYLSSSTTDQITATQAQMKLELIAL